MQHCKQRFTTACDSAVGDPMEWCLAELDMVNMYTVIPTPHVRDAVIYELIKVQERRRSRQPFCGSLCRKMPTQKTDWVRLPAPML